MRVTINLKYGDMVVLGSINLHLLYERTGWAAKKVPQRILLK